MPKGFKHLTYALRCQIAALKTTGMSQRLIGRQLGIHHSTVSRELSRNTGKRGYRYKQAQRLASERQHHVRSRVRVMTPQNVSLIERYLSEKWSPEQIAGRLKREGVLCVSHETIYQHIYRDRHRGGRLYCHLRHRGKKYNRRSKGSAGRGCIPNRVDIKQRPAIIEAKSRYGDWEGDLIIGAKHQGAIMTYVDRASKMLLMDKLSSKHTDGVVKKTIKLFDTIRRLTKTITYDNGKEFSSHRKIATALKTDIYFATPYHSWERGLNEHTNGLVRQYFPKSTNLLQVTDQQIKTAENAINNRPRKVLGYRTPREVFMAALKPSERVAFAT